MSSGRREREKEALRIMEALSGVDEDLLARSQGMDGANGAKGSEQGGHGKALRFVNRHGRALAACLCLVMLGAAYLTLEYRLGSKRNDAAENRSGEAYDADSLKNAANGLQDAAVQEAEETDNEAHWPGGDWAEGDGRADARDENHTATEDVSDGCGNANDGSPGLLAPEQAQDGQKEQMLSRELSLEDARACEALGSHVPETLPEDCEFLGASCEKNASDSRLVLTWSDGQSPFRLELSQTSFAKPEDAAAETGIAVYSADGAWEEAFWQPKESGRLRFAVLYGDGVLAEYEGCLGKEDVLTMFGKGTAEN